MRKFLVLLLACLLSTTVYAQEHLTFKGIPIDGNLNSFVSKLKAQGWNGVEVNEENAILEGIFGGESCKLLLYSTKSTKTVYQAVVILNNDSSWSSLKTTYNEYKALLKSKYGKGTSYEFFTSPYEEGDGYEMSALRNDKCTYATTHDVPNGTITLFIVSAYNGSVALYYVDKLNEALAEQEKSSQQINDL